MSATTRFHVAAMDCATEKAVISNRLGKLAEVEGTDFDLLERVVTVRHRDGAAAVVEAALREIEMAPRRLDDGNARAAPSVATGQRRRTILVAAAGALALGAELATLAVAENAWPVVVLAVAAILLAGPPTFRKGLVALRTRTLNINLLMTVAVAGALAIQQWPEAAMVTALFAFAELVEARAADRARDAVRALMALSPDRARMWRDEAWIEVEAAAVPLGARVQVRPGDRVPLDGKVVEGRTAIDQAPITGESKAVDKAPGDPVFAGTINQDGAIVMEVTAVQGDSTLARIGRVIRDAQAQQAPTQRFVDRFARVYTPIVVILAIGIAVVPPLVTSAAWQPWIYRALVLLVIACPCALVLSTPITVVSGLAAAARHGILVKGGMYLERAAHLRVVALDKTGTLTEGRPEVTDVVPFDGYDRDRLLALAASLEATSSHPLALAVVRAHGGPRLAVVDARNVVGQGVEGTVDGVALAIGNHAFAEARAACGPEVEATLTRLQQRGRSVMIVAEGRRIIGVLGVADVMRPASLGAIKAMRAQGLRLVMLTGDNAITAAAIATEIGLDEVRADLLPEHKLAIVEELDRAHGAVGMVGDGVNDAPALARASIGFAMGIAGTDTALETADVALMKDDLCGIPQLVELSRQVRRKLRGNIVFSLATKVVFFALAIAGIAGLWLAVLADLGASLIVAANGLALLRWRPTPTGAKVAP